MADRIGGWGTIVGGAILGLAGVARGAEDRHVLVISIDGLPGRYLRDPKVNLPTIRKLAAEGAVAEGGMVVSNPSVTWPNHTSMMTGVHADRHGVLYNGTVERNGPGKSPRVVFAARTQAELVRVPLLFDVLGKAGMGSAAINWPCTRGSTSIADNFPDVPEALKYTSEPLKAALDDLGYVARFDKGSAVVRDDAWVAATREAILKRKPRLIALHLLNLDGTHHRHGPESPEGYKAAEGEDANVGKILDALSEAGLRDRTSVFVVSDHGFAGVPRTIRPNAIFRREGLIRREGKEIRSARVFSVAEGGIAMVFLNDPATAVEDRATVTRLLAGAEGIASVISPEDYAKYHFPQPSEHDGMPGLVLAAKDGYGFSGEDEGDELVVDNKNPHAGSHGFLSTEPKMRATFVASGPGIKRGATLDAVEIVDLAPTFAAILGVDPGPVAGRKLEEILDLR